MDKTVSQLDPKLKEAYDRVMGTVVTPPANAAQAIPTTPPPAAPLTPSLFPMPSTTATPVKPSPISTIPDYQKAQSPTSAPMQAITAAKKKSGSKALIIMLAVIIFLIIYAIVWIKMFNLKVPFLNP